MIFKSDTVILDLIDVFGAEYGKFNGENTLRGYCALSVREESDTEIFIRRESYRLTGENISYFPADTKYRRLSSHDKMTVFHFRTLNMSDIDFKSVKIPSHAEAAALAQRALVYWREKKSGYKHNALSCLYGILALIQSETEREEDGSVIADSLDYIHSHFTDSDISVSDMAAASHISEVYLRRIFRRDYGMSPVMYLTKLRMEYAVSLLRSGYYTVETTAHMCGYDDAKYFSSLFKKTFGVCPREYGK